MLPTVQEAERELETAGQMNPGPWVKHSIDVGIAARNIAAEIAHMDGEKAFEIKETFEEEMGYSIYDVLPDIGKNDTAVAKVAKPPVS